MSLDLIRDYLSYDPETGVFTWIKKPKHSRVKVGDVAGTVRKEDGRRQIGFLGSLYFASRLAWFFVYGEMPSDTMEVDHKNRMPSDDRIDNLRLATRSQNFANSAEKSTNTSGFKGVFFDKRRGKYFAQISVGGVQIYLGTGKDSEHAAVLYDEAAVEHFGEFALVNFRGQNNARAA